MEHRLDIDGLRGIAVLSVLLCHAGFLPFSGGFIGVDVFFVISGYVITSSFLRQENDSMLHRISVKEFYTKRALRLLPALYLVLILTLIGGWFFAPPPEYVDLASYVAATLLFIANLYYGNIMGYFGPEADAMPLLHTWSLSVEEQFYFFFPFIFRFFRQYISLFLVISLISSFVYSCVVADVGGDWAFFSSVARFWEIFVGVAAALIPLRYSRLLPSWIGLVGFGLIIGSIYLGSWHFRLPGWPLLAPVIGSALIVVSPKSKSTLTRVLTFGPVLNLGRISYSAYLIHQPLFVLTREYNSGAPSTATMIGAVFTTLIISEIFYRYIETPFRYGLPDSLRRGRVVTIASLAGGILIFIVASVVHLSGGVPQRTTSVLLGDVGQDEFFQTASRKFFPCQPTDVANLALTYHGVLRCLQSKADGLPSVVLLGDSHAEHLVFGVAEALSHENVGVYIQNAPSLRSDPDFKAVFAALDSGAGLKLVLISNRWISRLAKYQSADDFAAELASTIRSLQRPGRTIVLLGDVANFASRAESCKNVLPPPAKEHCTLSRTDQRRASAVSNAMLARVVLETKVPFLSLVDLFCNDLRCNMVKNGKLMYRDHNHLNISGSNYVGSQVVDRLRAMGLISP